jgi:tetratricopeptide (TPR) repeat protein
VHFLLFVQALYLPLDYSEGKPNVLTTFKDQNAYFCKKNSHLQMKLSLVFLFCLLSLQHILAQDQMKIDSLKIQLNNVTEDTTRVKLLFALSDAYSRTDLVKALQYAKDALQVSTQAGSELLEARSYIKIGSHLILIGNYDEALKNFLTSLKLAQKNKFEHEEFVSLSNLGVIQDRIDKFDNALKYYFEALNIYNKGIENGKPIKEIKNIQGLYNNIGNIYASKNDLGTAEEYYLKGLAIAEQKLDYVNIGTICNNLGKLEEQKKNHDIAYGYLVKSIEARQKINDKSGIAKSYYSLANHYYEIQQLNEALDYAKKSFALGSELKEPLTRKISSMFLYKIYKKLGNWQEALEYHEIFQRVSDSLINDTKIQELTRLQMQYDYEKIEKDKEIKRQKSKMTYIILLSTVTAFSVILALLFFLARSRTKRIELEKEKLEKDMLIKNKELTTNVLYLLQKNELINSITARLLKLKANLKEENIAPVQKIIVDLQSITEKEVWEEFEYRFQSVHEEFYQNLKKKFPDLTPSEIKLAAFLRLNMTTKEIASITNQSVNSLETARYRLRKKLNITNQEVNLVNFLLNI